jgi:hypothetical protein
MNPADRSSSLTARSLSISLLLPLLACEQSVLPAGTPMDVAIEGLGAVDEATEGRLHVWVHPEEGAPVLVGELTDLPTNPGGSARLSFELPVADPVRLSVTLEPPGDRDDQPSSYVLLAGDFVGGEAVLSLDGQVTAGDPLQPDPGAHSLFTTSNNVRLGYPSFEESGLWLFSLRERDNVHGTREVRLTRLQPSWIYEGWIVRGFGGPAETWISYGKFRPDFADLLSSRDNTGSGPFSGDEDYLNAGVEDVPGDEWTTAEVAEQLGFSLPEGVAVPLLVNAVDPETGEAVWTHVITIEPAFDEDEPLYTGTPFFMRPYRNPVGAGGPGEPRVIQFVPGDVPAGVARPADG